MVTVGADQVWAQDSGTDGPVLVLLHPGIADQRVWEPVWEPLTSTHRVIRYDVRGFGWSPPATEPYEQVGDLITVLDHYGLGAVHLLGSAMGGSTALGLAIAAPERVESLVLLSPGISGYPYPEDPELARRWHDLVAARDGDGLVDLVLSHWCAAGQERFVRELVRDALGSQANGNSFWTEPVQVWGHLAEIKVPTVILGGDRDAAGMYEAGRAAAERIPGGRFVPLAGVDHLPQLRVPDLVVQTVRESCR